jgi:hypothetical protein
MPGWEVRQTDTSATLLAAQRGALVNHDEMRGVARKGVCPGGSLWTLTEGFRVSRLSCGRSFTSGRMLVRRGPLRAHRTCACCGLPPLYPLRASRRDGVVGAGADRRPHLPAAEGPGAGEAWRHPDGGFEKCFCRECGSHLFSRNPDEPAQMSVRLGAFDGDPGVRPSWRTYVAYAASWEPVPDDGLERFAEGRSRF